VKKTLRDLVLLVLVLMAGYNVLINFYVTPLVQNANKDIRYSCILSAIPGRLVFINFQYNNFECLFLTVDVSLPALFIKDYNRTLNGISLIGFKFSIIKGALLPKEEGPAINPAIVLPFCRYIDARFGTIEYEDLDNNAEFNVTGISGGSTYAVKNNKADEYMALDMKGCLQGRSQDELRLKLFFFPYYKNRFHLSAYGTKINVKVFEPLFKGFNLKFDSGRMNFLVQITGEMRKILVTNQMEFQGLKIHEETGIDFKALFGVSYEQMGRFLTDSAGNMYINFDFTTDDSQLGLLPALYAGAFASNVGDRIKLGVVTAPVRQVTDLIWNLTGENIFRIFRLFGGK
jgi:NADH:ubiquinone oxidoreductase subunit 3 (subunit A)